MVEYNMLTALLGWRVLDVSRWVQNFQLAQVFAASLFINADIVESPLSKTVYFFSNIECDVLFITGQIFFYSKSIFEDAKIPEDSIPFAVIGTNAVNVVMTFIAVLTTTFHRSYHIVLHFRPPVRSNGRSYKMLVMFLFFQRVISELPRPITAKLRHMIGTCVCFIN